MNNARATIRDVALGAGVSVTTVSHALNGKGKVSPETIVRVQATAERLGYQPSATAQALRSGHTGALALVLPPDGQDESGQLVRHGYCMQIAATSAAAAFAHNRPLILPPDLRTAADWARINPDGVLLCDPVSSDPRIDLLESVGIPVVTIERDGGRRAWNHYVAGDHVSNTWQVLDHLRGAGARRIALLATGGNRTWSADIDTAYASWCRQNGQDGLRVRVSGQFDQQDAYESAGALLDGPEPPDAFYAPAGGYSIGAARACHARGLRVPEDVLLVCGTDGREAQESTPAVTAIDLHLDQQTAAAIDLLIARIEGREAEAPVIVPSTLQVRASTTR